MSSYLKLRGPFLKANPNHEHSKSDSIWPPFSKIVSVWPITVSLVHGECVRDTWRKFFQMLRQIIPRQSSSWCNATYNTRHFVPSELYFMLGQSTPVHSRCPVHICTMCTANKSRSCHLSRNLRPSLRSNR
jgi:hypothetical protein